MNTSTASPIYACVCVLCVDLVVLMWRCKTALLHWTSHIKRNAICPMQLGCILLICRWCCYCCCVFFPALSSRISFRHLYLLFFVLPFALFSSCRSRRAIGGASTIIEYVCCICYPCSVRAQRNSTWFDLYEIVWDDASRCIWLNCMRMHFFFTYTNACQLRQTTNGTERTSKIRGCKGLSRSNKITSNKTDWTKTKHKINPTAAAAKIV